ncbi:MAG: TonB-dependent receptor [Rhodothermales bacterium]|nr:TonB-dependent receptor [Rhodothermales bacterium]
MPRRLAVLLAAVSLSTGAAAQSLTGRVVDAVTQEPLPGANVVVLGPDGAALAGAATDAGGAYELDGLAPGTYRVRASFVGYVPRVRTDVVVQASRPTFLLFELREAALDAGEVVVRAGFFEEAPDAPVSVQTLGPEEIRRTPGGQNDLSRSLLALPGVASGVDTRNDLLVRGGGPSENAYFVDGIEIPQINHFATQGASGGALGLLNVDFIREATFYTGGFPVRYGDAASSVLVVDNRPGSPEPLAGDFTVGASETALSLDGSSGDDFNWAFSGRRSYLQFLFQALGLPIRPAYWDFQSRVEWTPTRDDRFVYFGLWAIDDFDIVRPDDPDDFEDAETAARVLDNDQRSYTQGLSWRRLVPGGFFTTAVSRSYQDFAFADVGEDGGDLLSNDAEEAAWRLRTDGDLRLSHAFTLGLGGGVSRETIEAAFFQRATPATSFDEDLRFATDLGLWKGFGYAQLTARLLRDRLALTAGLRADATDFLDQAAVVSPRVSASYRLAERWEASAAVGRFTQAPELIALAVRDERGGYVNRGLRWIDVGQAVGGLAVTPVPSLRVSLEGFYKAYDDYPVSALDPRVSLANLGGEYGIVGAEPLRSNGKGRAYGVELAAQKRLTARVYGLGAYTLAWSEFTGGDGVYRPSAWDVRHTLSLTGGVRLGAWEVGTRLTVRSGRPFTPFDPAASAVEYALSRRGVPDLDRLNAERTPAYARWDLRVDRRFGLGPRVNGVVYLDVQNVLDRENVFGLEYTEDPAEPDRLREQTNVGRLPTVGFSVEF